MKSGTGVDASAAAGPRVDGAERTLGERIRAARQQLGMSQSELAGDELSKGFISQVESGLARPSVRSLQVIAHRLGKPLDYFIGDEPLAADKRVAFHALAAEAALERSDWTQVREHAQRGLEHSSEPRDRARLMRLLARADIAAREHEAAFERINAALALLDPATDAEEIAYLLSMRGYGYFDLNQFVAAIEAYEACRDVIDRYEIVDPRLRARALMSLATSYRRLNRTTKALSTYEQALSIASRSSEMDIAARSFMGIAAAHYDSGEMDAAVAHYRRALELFRRIADLDFELSALQSVAVVQFEAGQVRAAKDSAQRALDRAQEVGNSHWAAVAETILARVALTEGRVEEALRSARHAEKVLAESGDQGQRADTLGVIGMALEVSGQTAAADRSFRKAIEIYTSIDDHADRSALAADYAKVLRARGEVDAAFEMLELARGAASKR